MLLRFFKLRLSGQHLGNIFCVLSRAFFDTYRDDTPRR